MSCAFCRERRNCGTRQALGSLVSILGVAVLVDLPAAATLAEVNGNCRKCPQTSTLPEPLATVRFLQPHLGVYAYCFAIHSKQSSAARLSNGAMSAIQRRNFLRYFERIPLLPACLAALY